MLHESATTIVMANLESYDIMMMLKIGTTEDDKVELYMAVGNIPTFFSVLAVYWYIGLCCGHIYTLYFIVHV